MASVNIKFTIIGVLFGCFGRKIDGPGLPGGLIIYQGHLFALKGHLCSQWTLVEGHLTSWDQIYQSSGVTTNGTDARSHPAPLPTEVGSRKRTGAAQAFFGEPLKPTTKPI